MKILVIWELVPEATKFYITEGTPDKIVQSLKLCHGSYIGTDNSGIVDDALEQLDSKLEQEEGPFEEIKMEEVMECKPDLIIHTGIIL